MKKKDLSTLAMIGISAGLLIGGCQQSQQGTNSTWSNIEKLSTELHSFYNSLSPEGKQKFLGLDLDSKRRAFELSKEKGADAAVNQVYNEVQKNRPNGQIQTSGVSGDLSPEMQHFYQNLSLEGQRRFLTLDAQHKMMALHMMEQRGEGQNDCKGLGGCKNDLHECAGLNDCRNQGGKPVASPDKAVQAQYGNQWMRKENQKGKVPNS